MPLSESGAQTRADRADSTDAWLRRLWRAAAGADEDGWQGIALAAVGSHARREAGPNSDLDLILLHDDRLVGQSLAALADRLWYPIWDGSRRLDHSVRSVSQSRSVAAADLPALVGLLDLRLIGGDSVLVEATRSLVGRDWRAAARGRLDDVLASVRARHARFGDLAAMTDPDLKECRGGLRDMAVLRALTAAWLADRPHGEVDAAYQVLLDVRDGVHQVTGRGRDRLARQDAPEVAARLGLAGPSELTALVGAAARTVAQALEATVRRAQQAQRAGRPQRVGPRSPRLTSLGFGVYQHDGEVVVAGAPVRVGDPLLGLRAAAAAATAGLMLSPATVTTLAGHPAPQPPWSGQARELFGELLAAGPGLPPVWEALAGAGVVQRWLPAWGSVRGLAQISAVHRHSVDRHQLETVVRCAPLLSNVTRPDLLLVTALLHDIGKPGPDHPALGAPIAAAAATALGFPAPDTEVVALLVRGHLLLADLATTCDPRDPATVEGVLSAVDSQPEVLELLAALTEADGRATGGPAWSSARRTAVLALTATSRRLLTRRLPPPMPLPDPTPPQPTLRDAVAAHGPLVVVGSVGPPGTQIEVLTYAQDRLGLFADVAALLRASGLQVRSAELATTRRLAHGQWQVLAADGVAPQEVALTRRLRRLEAGDRSVLRGATARTIAVDRLDWLTRPTRLSNPTRGPGSAGNESAATLLQVRAPDAPGLVHAIGTAFASAAVAVRQAKIVTLAGRALDTFTLTTPHGRPLGPRERRAVEQALLPPAPAG